MKAKTEAQENERFSIEQIRFLTELEKLDKKRGAVEMISKKFGFSHSKISRFFKSCVEKEYLTSDLKTTEKGKRLLEWNQHLEQDVRKYLIRMGVKDGLDNLTKALYENADYEILEKTIAEYPRIQGNISKIQKTVVTDVREVLDCGRHKVQIAIFQSNSDEGLKKSMADRGFERYAWLVYEEDKSFLELELKNMHALSRVNGRDMVGHLASLKYLEAGIVQNAEVEDGKVRIPLSACYYENFGRGIIWGNVMITVGCSVGSAHMPESTARLVFIF